MTTPVTESDRRYMMRALELASHGLYTTYPNPAVGCVFVRGDQIIGEGWHHKAGQSHAEVMAIENAGGDVKGATAYVTLEPCSHYGRTPPCALRLVEEGVARVFIAAGDPNPKVSGKGVKILRDAGIDVIEHVMEREAWFLNRAFMKAIVSPTPFVTAKIGMSLDGAIALKNRESKWITDEVSRQDVQDLRAQCDCIITTFETVKADDPLMNVRYDELPAGTRAKVSKSDLRQPLKIVVNTDGILDEFSGNKCRDIDEFRIFKEGRTIIVEAGDMFSIPETKLNDHVSIVRLQGCQDGDFLSLKGLLEYLGTLKIRHVMVEAGPTFTNALLKADLVDELYIYQAPKFLGNEAYSAFIDIESPRKLKDAKSLVLHDVEKLKNDIRIRLLSKSIARQYDALTEV